MHEQSMRAMSHFVDSFLDVSKEQHVLDVGSQNINGTYQLLIATNPNWKYVGLDQAHGKNVDVVVQNPYRWPEVSNNSYDVIISGQMFEHCPQFWKVAEEIQRVLKPGGLLCIIVPCWYGHEHRYPVDCYRFLPDGLRAIADSIGFNVIIADYVNRWKPAIDTGHWNDTILVARKPWESKS